MTVDQVVELKMKLSVDRELRKYHRTDTNSNEVHHISRILWYSDWLHDTTSAANSIFVTNHNTTSCGRSIMQSIILP